jgi:hypothetical protein
MSRQWVRRSGDTMSGPLEVGGLLAPAASGVHDLGSSGLRWRFLYLSDRIFQSPGGYYHNQSRFRLGAGAADGAAYLRNDGGTASAFLQQSREALTAGGALSDVQSNAVLLNTGAGALVNYTLPTPRAGLGPFTFVRDDGTWDIQCTAPGSVTIHNGASSSSSGGTATSSAQWDTWTVIGVDSTNYVVIAAAGTAPVLA